MYSRWATNEELLTILTKIDAKSEVKKSGVPIMYDNKSMYIKDDETHTMVIATSGSGKIQSILLPQTRLAIKSGESLLVNDKVNKSENNISDNNSINKGIKFKKLNLKIIDFLTKYRFRGHKDITINNK